jgi:hypothetical protein
LKTVVVSRPGDLSVAAHLTEMRNWLADQRIQPRELVMLHVLNFRVVFRGTFETVEQADRFAEQFS